VGVPQRRPTPAFGRAQKIKRRVSAPNTHHGCAIDPEQLGITLGGCEGSPEHVAIGASVWWEIGRVPAASRLRTGVQSIAPDSAICLAMAWTGGYIADIVPSRIRVALVDDHPLVVDGLLAGLETTHAIDVVAVGSTIGA
jgi:hypothetical protein